MSESHFAGFLWGGRGIERTWRGIAADTATGADGNAARERESNKRSLRRSRDLNSDGL